MSEIPDPNIPIRAELWFNDTVRKADGSIYTKRQRQNILKKYGIETVRIGWCEMVIPSRANKRIAELFPEQEPPRPRRGRPRKYNQAAD